MNKLRKNKKGFTLVEIIVVLVIIAILIAALAPVMIGWINEARETTVRSEGRTVLIGLQTVSAERRALATSTSFNAQTHGWAGDVKFRSLMEDSDLWPITFTTSGTQGIRTVYDIRVNVNGDVVGIIYGNPVRNRVVDTGVPAGQLLIGRMN
jgi:prepilin-type N-terminal cleavage/methylation domain-containing protein